MDNDKKETVIEITKQPGPIGMVCVTIMFVSLMAALAFGKTKQ